MIMSCFPKPRLKGALAETPLLGIFVRQGGSTDKAIHGVKSILELVLSLPAMVARERVDSLLLWRALEKR
jgi:hypothetical protein